MGAGTIIDEEKYQIRDVWANNLEEEMRTLRAVVENYPYISMDTEFPGVVARPVGNFKSTTDYQFQTLRCNVDLLKIIQLGLTFSDENGNLPRGVCTWQFNFKFSLTDDMFAQDSIDLLQKSGIDFQKHSQHGIEIETFGELLLSSGFVLLEDVKWISFHGTYDFGYLLKLLTFEPLPEEEGDFHSLLRTFFPCLYDIKYLVKSCKALKGGLQEVADLLEVERIGPQHQAGSDSLLTSVTFFKLRKLYFDDCVDDVKYLGHLYGLGAPHSKATNPAPKSASEATSTSTSTSTSSASASASTPTSSVSSLSSSSSLPSSSSFLPSTHPSNSIREAFNAGSGTHSSSPISVPLYGNQSWKQGNSHSGGLDSGYGASGAYGTMGGGGFSNGAGHHHSHSHHNHYSSFGYGNSSYSNYGGGSSLGSYAGYSNGMMPSYASHMSGTQEP